jgi:hypothetical protein
MSINPYQPPSLESQPPPVVGVLSGSREDLRAVAQYQRGIVACVGVYLILVIVQFALPLEQRWILALLLIPLIPIATAFVFLLSTKVYGMGLGILLGVLTMIPCVGLIPLLVLNAKATSVLNRNGIPVGLLGADSKRI